MRWFLLLLLLLFSGFASGAYMDFDGFGRVRGIRAKNYNFTDGIKDTQSFTSYRFQLNAKMAMEKNADTNVYLSSRFSKIAGDFSGGQQTSGNLGNENPATIHQAYIAHRFNDALAIKLGRMEVNYGDQLAIGGVGWSDLGRSFDGAALSYNNKFGKTDFFVMTVKELTGMPLGNKHDHNLYGVYHSGRFGENFDEVDAYFLFDEDVPSSVNVKVLGLRAKSKVGEAFDYRTEAIFEKIKNGANKESAYMVDAELGYSLGKFRLALEYSRASEHFEQLYPTGHKWLGFADLFKRSNLEQKALHLSYKHDANTTAKLSFHMFDRVKVTNDNFRWNAPASAPNNEKNLGHEIDITIHHKLSKAFAVELGYSTFLVGDYYDKNGLKDDLHWGYVQFLAKF